MTETPTTLRLSGYPINTYETAVGETRSAIDSCTTTITAEASAIGAEVAWGMIYGQLRGKIPYPIPTDLMAVSVAFGIRWGEYVGNSQTVQIQGADVVGFAGPQFVGFTISELIVLWRYRIRTA